LNEEGFVKKGMRWLAKTKAGRVVILVSFTISLPFIVAWCLGEHLVDNIWPELKGLWQDYREFYANGYD